MTGGSACSAWIQELPDRRPLKRKNRASQRTSHTHPERSEAVYGGGHSIRHPRSGENWVSGLARVLAEGPEGDLATGLDFDLLYTFCGRLPSKASLVYRAYNII